MTDKKPSVRRVRRPSLVLTQDQIDSIAQVAFTFGEFLFEGLLWSAERHNKLQEMKDGADTTDIPRGEDAPAAGDPEGDPTS